MVIRIKRCEYLETDRDNIILKNIQKIIFASLITLEELYLRAYKRKIFKADIQFEGESMTSSV